jgi:4,5-dihydroxyphthalate decarboxylase
MLPWLTAEHEQTQAVMGDDFWPYGMDANLDMVKTQIRWSFEQGLIPRQYDVQEMFVSEPR